MTLHQWDIEHLPAANRGRTEFTNLHAGLSWVNLRYLRVRCFIMDNGRLKIENYKGVMYCEAYLDAEYTVDDIKVMLAEARANFIPPVDVILKKTGSYSLTLDAQLLLARHVAEFREFVYVVDNVTKKSSAEYAIATYMKVYNTRIAGSKEEAYELLAGNN